MTSLNAVSTLFGGTAPHGLKELYGENFDDGSATGSSTSSAPASGAINLLAFTHKIPPTVEAYGTWTHIAVPYYNDGGVQLQNRWRINPRVGTNTSLFSHGPPISSNDWPTKIRLNEGYLTPTQWYDLTGGGNPAGVQNPRPIGVVFVDPFWKKTRNQTT